MARCENCLHYRLCVNIESQHLRIILAGDKAERCRYFKSAANVAPKSEVERLERICNSYALQYGTVMDQQKVIDKAKTEVAGDVITDLQQLWKVCSSGMSVKGIDCYVISKKDYHSIIADLKKKYKGEQT